EAARLSLPRRRVACLLDARHAEILRRKSAGGAGAAPPAVEGRACGNLTSAGTTTAGPPFHRPQKRASVNPKKALPLDGKQRPEIGALSMEPAGLEPATSSVPR